MASALGWDFLFPKDDTAIWLYCIYSQYIFFFCHTGPVTRILAVFKIESDYDD